MISSRRSVVVLAAAAVVLAPLAAATPAGAAATPKAGKCYGKKPTLVVTKPHVSLTLTARNRNAVVDLLGKGDTLSAGKAKGNTYVCDTGGARSITTGDGNDKVTIKDGSPVVNTGKGNDTFTQTGTGNPTVHLGAGVDSGSLGKGNGTVYGDDGNDSLRAGSKGRQKLYGGHGHDTLVAGAATSTLDGQDGGTSYLVSGVYAGHTTVVLHPGDTVNGKSSATQTPGPVLQPVAPVVSVPPMPPVPLPVGTVVTLGTSSATGVTSVGSALKLGLTGAPAAGHSVAQWALDFGDGSFAHRGVGLPPASIGHTYYSVGTVTPTLTLTDELGHSSVSSASLDVAGADGGGFSIISATGTPLHQTSKTVSLITALSPGQRAAFILSSVDFGDGSQQVTTGAGPAVGLSHSYDSVGSYTISIAATDDHGGTETVTETVNVVDSGVHATLVDAKGQALTQILAERGDNVSLSALRSVGTGDGVLSALTFDAGNGSGAKDILATGSVAPAYATGAYVAKLVATSHGVSSTTQFKVYVASTTQGTIAVADGATSVPAGQPVTFTTTTTLGSASDSGGPQNYATDERVTFDDGTDDAHLSGDTVTHTFSRPGIYSVNYYVSDTYHQANGASGIDFDVTQSTPYLSLSIAGQTGPWVGTTTSPAASPGTSYKVIGLGSSDHLAGATYRLDFGDGTTPVAGKEEGGAIDDEYSQHAYTTPGEFTATATVTDATGKTVTASLHVSVTTPPTLVLGTPTVSGGMLTQPVISTSPGSDGAVPDTYVDIVLGPGNTVASPQATANGAPPASLSFPVGTTGPFTVVVYYLTDHGLVGASDHTS